MSTNFERMIQLAEDVFAAKNDPDQLDVDETVISHLQKIHPYSVSEYDDGNGPAAWILLIPTTKGLMDQFLENKISEKELYELTPLNAPYEALYLCSAMVLEEYRRKGIAKRLTLKAIEEIKKDHPIKALFVWAFTKEGELAAEALSEFTGLPLHKLKGKQ
jgi:ribosomal protein S18 acetylase RimI-like enzyme